MSRKKVLVVDDEGQFLEMIKLRLEANGYEVVTACNGREALEKIESDKPDVVFLDILMPQLDGVEALRAIREKNKDLPVFITTAFSTQERFKLAKGLDASGFIVKTGDLNKEIDNITSMLSLADKYKSKK
ncbi:MAG: response regulator [Candidatus Omnitrophica bacterium]|nr:response regulator [Candidatus Omnitrophota bacterium]